MNKDFKHEHIELHREYVYKDLYTKKILEHKIILSNKRVELHTKYIFKDLNHIQILHLYNKKLYLNNKVKYNKYK